MEEFYDAQDELPGRMMSKATVENEADSRMIDSSTSPFDADGLSKDEPNKLQDGGPISQSPSKLDKVRNVRDKTKSKAKEILRIGSPESESESVTPETKLVHNVTEDPAFNPMHLLEPKSHKIMRKNSVDLKEAATGVVNSVVHPVTSTKDSFKKKAAREISRAQRPYLSTDDDGEFLAAHDEWARSASHSGANSASDSDEETLEERRRKVERLEEHRESLRIAWSLGRHVDRVRTVRHYDVVFPRKLDFVERDMTGERKRFKWEEYLGHLALYYTRTFTAQYIDDFDDLPFDLDTLSRTVERVVLASTPWQNLYMSMRSLYRWENPRRTGFWFFIWLILWQTQHMAGFVYIYIVYVVMKERFYPSSVSDIRTSLDRTLDIAQTAHAWGELVDKHGRTGWIEPLLEEVGPQLQLQLGDLADFLEVLLNFYRWARPKQTAASVFFFFCCFLVTILTDMEYCMQIVYFISIGSFFLCWPISSRYPKYRYLVDPFKWIYWDIPTHAEMSLWDLRKRAVLHQLEVDAKVKHQEDRNRQSNDHGNIDSIEHHDFEEDLHQPRSAPDLEVFKFKVYSDGLSGRILIDRRGITFTRLRRSSWFIPHVKLVEMRKESAPKSTKVKSLAQAGYRVFLFYTDDEGKICEQHIDADQGVRDEIFCIILGWSGIHWKALRSPDRKKGAKI